jgi:hypothetical protein
MTENTKITTALHAIMSQVSYVQKTGKNAFHGYKYAGEADLLAVLRPAMIEHGLMLFPSVENVSPPDDNGNVMVMMSYTLVHKDGEVWPEKLHAAGMGNDRAKNGTIGDKGVYKAITGANKYLLFKLFQIETGDDPEVVSDHDKTSEAPQAEAPKTLVKDQRAIWADMRDEIDACTTLEELGMLWGSPAFKAEFKKLKPDWAQQITEHKDARKADLSMPPRARVAPAFDNLETTR